MTITPAANQSGTATIGINAGTVSTSFVLTVTPPAAPVSISSIPAQTTTENTATKPVAFTLGNAPASLTLTATSSNPTLAPVANIVLSGSGASRTVTITPAANQFGTATIGINAGSASTSFVLTVTPAFTGGVGPSQVNSVRSANLTYFQYVIANYPLSQSWTDSTNLCPSLTPSGATLGFSTWCGWMATPAGGSMYPQHYGDTATAQIPYGLLLSNGVYGVAVEAMVYVGNLGLTNGSYPIIGLTQGVNALQLLDGTTTTFAGTPVTTAMLPANSWHYIKMMLDTNGYTLKVDANTVISVSSRDLYKWSPNANATLTLGNFNGLLAAVDIKSYNNGGPNILAPVSISSIPAQTTPENTATKPIVFTLGNARASLTLTATSSNPTLAPVANIVLGGSGANRTVTITPAANQFGTATIGINAGTVSNSFILTVTPVCTGGAGPSQVNSVRSANLTYFQYVIADYKLNGSWTDSMNFCPSLAPHGATVGFSTWCGWYGQPPAGDVPQHYGDTATAQIPSSLLLSNGVYAVAVEAMVYVGNLGLTNGSYPIIGLTQGVNALQLLDGTNTTFAGTPVTTAMLPANSWHYIKMMLDTNGYSLKVDANTVISVASRDLYKWSPNASATLTLGNFNGLLAAVDIKSYNNGGPNILSPVPVANLSKLK